MPVNLFFFFVASLPIFSTLRFLDAQPFMLSECYWPSLIFMWRSHSLYSNAWRYVRYSSENHLCKLSRIRLSNSLHLAILETRKSNLYVIENQWSTFRLDSMMIVRDARLSAFQTD